MVASTAQNKIASQILAVVRQNQRLDEQAACLGRSRCVLCMKPHLDRVARFVAAGEPVQFVLPGFPGKSPNPAKVLGVLPDMAERLSLNFLQRLCERIRAVYEPGARLIICSDGRVFVNVVEFDDSHVTAYHSALQRILDEMDGCSLGLFALDQLFPGQSNESLRTLMLQRYADDLDDVREHVRADSESRRKYLGLAKFLFEDMLMPDYRGSRRALLRKARQAAYHLLQRSDAWNALLADRFPDAVRLSIHPQPCGSTKLGIHLMDSRDNWMTPWHGVAVEVSGRWTLMKRSQAEELGADLVHVDGQPSHFQARAIHPVRPRCPGPTWTATTAAQHSIPPRLPGRKSS